MKIHWLDRVEDKDYGAAYMYLTLRLDNHQAETLERELRDAPLTKRRVNDILRACDREPLPVSDPGVRRARDHVRSGKRLSPVLVVSFDFGGDIADGYHRVSAAYWQDPFAYIPCKIAHG